MTGPGFLVRPTVEDDWRKLKALRLEMLADTPKAYLETPEMAKSHPDRFWQERARTGRSEDILQLAAILDDGRWVGQMVSRLFRDTPDPYLLAVYVAPDLRGSAPGVTDALLTGIEEWARTKGPGLLLDVHADNLRARAAYAKRGFVETGRTKPYPLNPLELEVEMRKSL
jgi:GNAT superfamily N-acetyltransferase